MSDTQKTQCRLELKRHTQSICLTLFRTNRYGAGVVGRRTYTLTPQYLYLILSFTTHDYLCNGIFMLFYVHIYDEHNIFDHLSFLFEVDADDFEIELVKRLAAINLRTRIENVRP
jgi:hypothetical protein